DIIQIIGALADLTQRSTLRRYGLSVASVRTVSAPTPSSAISPEFNRSSSLRDANAIATSTSAPSTKAIPEIVNTIDTTRLNAVNTMPGWRTRRRDPRGPSHDASA